MKSVAIALSALVALTGAANAANLGSSRERPEAVTTSAISGASLDVRAGNLLSSKDLSRKGVAADEVVKVTLLPKGNAVENLGSDR